jgi:hypothetical protein
MEQAMSNTENEPERAVEIIVHVSESLEEAERDKLVTH